MNVHQFSLVCWIAGSLVGLATAVVSADDSAKSLRLQSLDELVKLTELAREQEKGADSEAVQVTLKKITDLSTDLSRQTVGQAGTQPADERRLLKKEPTVPAPGKKGRKFRR